MKKQFIIAILFLLPYLAAFSQQKLELKLNTNFAYKGNKALTESIQSTTIIKGKKVILDLFNSSCIVCFRMLPKIQTLQDKFGSNLQFILLGDEDAHIRKVYEKFRKNMGLEFTVVYDSVFFRSHDIPFVPRYIWIDEFGIVRAVTGPDEITENNIRSFIKYGSFAIKPVVERIAFSADKLLLTGGNGGTDTSFLFRSVLSLYQPSLIAYTPLKLEYDKNNMFQALGVTMADLYRYAYFGKARWNIQDSLYGEYALTPLFTTDRVPDSPAIAKRYCYSFKSPDVMGDEDLLQRALRNDLATFFGYEVMLTRLKMPCWKLIALPGFRDQLRTKFAKQRIETTYAGMDFNNVPVAVVLENMYYLRTDEYPYINETGINFNIDLSLEGMMTDPLELHKALRKAGLALVEGEKEMWVLILSDAKKAIAVK